MVAEAFAEPSDIQRVTSSDVAFQDLVNGKVDAVITDFDFAQSQVRKLGRPTEVIKVLEGNFPEDYSGVSVEQYGIAVAKPETDLLDRLNNTIALAEQKNILKTLKAQYVTKEHQPIVLRRLPDPDFVAPLTYETTPLSTAVRR